MRLSAIESFIIARVAELSGEAAAHIAINDAFGLWLDSLEFIQLLSDVEQRFKMKIGNVDAVKLLSVESMARFVEAHVNVSH